jgi:hypothetical protein
VLQNRADCRIEVNTLVEVERAESRAGFLFLGGGREGARFGKGGLATNRKEELEEDRTGQEREVLGVIFVGVCNG